MTIDHDLQTAEVRSALRRTADDITVAPDLLGAVRRGASRRRRQRRVTFGLVAVATAAAVVAGFVTLPGLSDTRRTDRSTSTAASGGPTQGDLAGDQAYLTSVIDAWNASHQASGNAMRGIFDDLRGDPTVVWAGRTPAGRAAVVHQQAYLHPHSNFDESGANRLAILAGFVSDVDGRPTVVDDDYGPDGRPTASAFYAGADRSVLVVLDTGRLLSYAVGRIYQPDGRIIRRWQPLRFTDGAAVVQVPARSDQRGAIVVAGEPFAGHGDALFLANSVHFGPPVGEAEARLPWLGGFPLAGSDTPLSPAAADQACPQQPRAERDPFSWKGADGTWCVFGTTPNGRTVIASEECIDNDPCYVYYRVVAGGVTFRSGNGGVVDRTKPLPVRVELPDGQGWVVAAKDATLSYRVDNGPWQGTRRNAALLPAAATAVRVTGNGPQTVVPLS